MARYSYDTVVTKEFLEDEKRRRREAKEWIARQEEMASRVGRCSTCGKLGSSCTC